MLRLIPYVLAGSFFGVIMYKSEAASWYRIQEMFRFGSFHMYGIIMVAVAMGALGYLLINKFKLKDLKGQPIVIPDKAPGWKRYLLGGLIFGLFLSVLIIFRASKKLAGIPLSCMAYAMM